MWRVLRAEVKSKGLWKPFKALNFSLKAKRSSIPKTFKAKCVCVCVHVSERGLILERLPDSCVKKEGLWSSSVTGGGGGGGACLVRAHLVLPSGTPGV